MEKLQHIETFATELIKEYVPHYSFCYTNRKKQYGYCNYSSRQIGLSKFHALHSTEADVLDTILHEIAHALVGYGNGHNHVWKAKCREIGAKPERCASVSILNAGHKYEFRCATCVKVYPMFKKVREGNRWCVKCKTPVTFHVVG